MDNPPVATTRRGAAKLASSDLHGELVILVLVRLVLQHLVLEQLVLQHRTHFRVAADFNSSVAAFLLEHGRDVARRSIAEQLAELLLVVGDAMFFDEAHEVGGSVAGERRFGEMRIGGKEILRAAVQVGEIAAAAAGDQDFLADSIGAFEHQNTPAALAGFNGTHQAGRAGSENDDVVFPIHAGMSLAGAARQWRSGVHPGGMGKIWWS